MNRLVTHVLDPDRLLKVSFKVSIACLVATVSAYPRPDGPGGHGIAFPKPGADGGYGGENYFQYINVPAPHTFEWGYRRGNPDHNREEYLSQKDHTFKAKVTNYN